LPHYYDERPDGKGMVMDVAFMARGRQFSMKSSTGVFSKSKLDRGTSVLLDHCLIKGRVLDLGCGWGPVGTVIKTLYPDTDVVMADVNHRALSVARMNVEHLGVDVIASDGFSRISGEFDTILLNPPMAAGRKVCFRLIDESYQHINVGGSLQLVARHRKGGEQLEIHMRERFGNITTLAKKGGFRVYQSVRSTSPQQS